jgi:hypothetical protein
MLVERADALEGRAPGSGQEGALAAITDTIEAYEAIRWPSRCAEKADPRDISR